MPERWVVNASPLIALGSIGRLDLLTSLADEVVIPEIVAEELLRVADEAALAFSRSPLRRARRIFVENLDTVSPGQTEMFG